MIHLISSIHESGQRTFNKFFCKLKVLNSIFFFLFQSFISFPQRASFEQFESIMSNVTLTARRQNSDNCHPNHLLLYCSNCSICLDRTGVNVTIDINAIARRPVEVMIECVTIVGQYSLCAPLIHPASSRGSSVPLPNHFPKFAFDIATEGTVILYCFSFLLLSRYSFSSLLRSAILTYHYRAALLCDRRFITNLSRDNNNRDRGSSLSMVGKRRERYFTDRASPR